MPYGRLNAKQEAEVRRWVEGYHVHDLGAGDLVLSHKLLDLGAIHVTAIDRELSEGRTATRDRRITCFQEHFHNTHDQISTAFVSWPCNWQDSGLLRLLTRTSIILYLGTNTRGTACGGPDLFGYLTQREVLAYEPWVENTLIVYGPRRIFREPRGEEKAALNSNRIWSYEEAEGDARP